MNTVDTAAAVGEMLGWIGLVVGIPLLLLAMMVRIVEGRWVPQEIAVVERGERDAVARWFVAGDFHERPLRPAEYRYDEGLHDGVVSTANADRARLGDPPHLQRLLWTLGGIFTGIGLVGVVVSFLPAFL